MEVGRSIPRVDAADKVTGRAKYTDDLCPRPVLEAKILHSTIANGWVKSMDISAAQALPGVVKVLTCFDVPDIQYPTPGHPWSVEKAHQDVSDRKLLNRRVRIYGDDIAAVVAEDPRAYLEERGLPLTKVHGDWNQARYPLEELGALPGVQLTASNDHDFELVPDRVDKGRAMALIALLYGVPLGETAAVGDSDNDLAALKAAGLPIAMGNASGEVKALCRWETDTNAEDGVAHAIDRILAHNKACDEQAENSGI